MFSKVLEADDLSHFTQVDGSEVAVRTVLAADVQEVTQSVVALLGRVSGEILIRTQLLLQKAKHDVFVGNIRTEAITQRSAPTVNGRRGRGLTLENKHHPLQDGSLPESDVFICITDGVSLGFDPQRHGLRHVGGDVVSESLQPQNHPLQGPVQLPGPAGRLHGQHEGAVQLGGNSSTGLLHRNNSKSQSKGRKYTKI